MALSSKSKEIRPSSGKWDGRILQCHHKEKFDFSKNFLYNIYTLIKKVEQFLSTKSDSGRFT